MSHSELLLQKLGKTGVQRAEPSVGVRGVPCNPGQGLAALDYPACEGAEKE